MPSVVVLFDVVGFGLVLQQMPLLVTAAPPLLVILPPLNALKQVMEVGMSVVIVGTVVIQLVVTPD